jgi:hypothetical protein
VKDKDIEKPIDDSSVSDAENSSVDNGFVMRQLGNASVQIGQIKDADITLNIYSEPPSATVDETDRRSAGNAERLSEIDLAISKERELEKMARRILDYMCECMNRTFTEQGIVSHTAKIVDLIQRGIAFEQIIKGITEAKGIYLKFDNGGVATESSVNNFLGKYSGLIVNRSKPPIEQKIAHLCNTAKQGVDDWRQNEAKTILKNYIAALRKKNWSDDEILADLTNEVMQICRDAYSWSWWRNRINGWIDDINNWQ